MFFWNSLAFSTIQRMLAIWFLVPLPFLNPACTSGSSWFKSCWSLIWRILSITLLAWEVNVTVRRSEHSSALPFFGMNWYEYWPFSVLWTLLSFPNWWHFECSTFTASSFRIWTSWVGIPSPPLALFIVMLPKAHLTLHSRLSGFRWVITQSWLSGSLKFFCTVFFMYFCHLFCFC